MSGLEKAKSDVVEQFTAQVDRFVTSPHVNQPEPVARYVGTVAPRGDERVLGVGCGPGLLAKAFAPHVREYVGVDLTPAMVAKAADIARAAGIANARFEVGDALALPFEAASFDLALSRLALHHMSDPRRAIQQMARALQPGGRLALFDMITSEVTEESAYHNLVERLRDPSHTRALPPSELFHYAGLAGLVADRLETIDYDIDVDDWIARADQPAEDARKTRELLADAIGTRRFGGRRVWRDDTGKLWFTVRGAIVCATKPAPG